MPAQLQYVGSEDKVHLLAAYVYSLSQKQPANEETPGFNEWAPRRVPPRHPPPLTNATRCRTHSDRLHTTLRELVLGTAKVVPGNNI